MRPAITEITCQCGEVQGQIDSVTPKSSNHMTCHCKYCSGFAAHLGQAERLVDGLGASDLLQVAPWSVRFTSGEDRIKALKFSETGPLRWYASCCNTPLAITLSRRFPPFCAFVVQNLHFPSGASGPVIFNAFCDRVPDNDSCAKGGRTPALRILARLLKQAAKGGLSGKWRRNAFLDLQGGKAMMEAAVLSTEERRKAFEFQLV